MMIPPGLRLRGCFLLNLYNSVGDICVNGRKPRNAWDFMKNLLTTHAMRGIIKTQGNGSHRSPTTERN